SLARHLVLHPEAALLRHHHRHRFPVPCDDEGATDAVVVWPFHRPHAFEAELIVPRLNDCAGRECYVTLDSERLHGRERYDCERETDVRHRHAEHRTRECQATSPPIDRIDERGQQDPRSERRADRTEEATVRIEPEDEAATEHSRGHEGVEGRTLTVLEA